MTPASVPPDSVNPLDRNKRPISRWKLFWSAVLVSLSVVIYLKIFLLGANFRDIFRGFGMELPLLTQYVFASYSYYGLLVLVGAVPCALLFKNRGGFDRDENPLFFLVLVGFGLSLAVLAVFVVAMYLPMFAPDTN